MTIDPSIIRKYYDIKSGSVYWGKLAKDKSPHVAVVICVKDNKVFYFCLTSSETFINFIKKNDKFAVVQLSPEEQKIYFNDNIKEHTFIYCGKSGLGDKSLEEFIEDLSEGLIQVKEEVPTDLMCRISTAIMNSSTYSEDEKDFILTS